VSSLPIIDMSPLFDPGDVANNVQVANAIRDACRNSGFFYVVGHGIDPTVLAKLDSASRRFFALSLDLDRDYFSTAYTPNATVLFHIFHYPSVKGEA
jgi:isopenicillin N synthase-like dioxygenase